MSEFVRLSMGLRGNQPRIARALDAIGVMTRGWTVSGAASDNSATVLESPVGEGAPVEVHLLAALDVFEELEAELEAAELSSVEIWLALSAFDRTATFTLESSTLERLTASRRAALNVSVYS